VRAAKWFGAGFVRAAAGVIAATAGDAQIGHMIRPLPSAAIAAALIVGSMMVPSDLAAQPRRVPEGRQVILVTGSTDGLGREVARRLAATGAHVIVHGRNRERGAAVVQEIEREGKGSAAFYPADLSSLAQVRELGAAILRDYQRLDVLVNNAGIWINQGPRQLSADGHELPFAVNYLSGYVLTRTLLPLLTKSAPSRIVNVASAAQTPIDFTDVMLERGYSGGRAYAQSKLAQILFTVDLSRELAGKGVTVVALHPASMMNTTMVEGSGMPARSTVAEGADAAMRAITERGIESGTYFNRQTPTRANAQAYDPEALEKLRALSRKLTGM
jgi:NAD(P)-dependent dehydrogenase (short-subunit alcohol dehydrogenase family)